MSIFDLFKKIEGEKSPQGSVSCIIVGLGNPGEKYVYTRHNAGFLALDYLCQTLGVKCDRAKFKALTCEATIGDKRALIMKPQTFMNASGEAVREAMAFYKLTPEDVFVISDDTTLDVGKMRIRKKGSAGGHNGLKSIIEQLGTDEFPRIKIGVGQKPSREYDLADWVLGVIPKADRETLFAVLERCPDALNLITRGEFELAMQKFN